MAKSREFKIMFPVAGLDRHLSVQSQPPYTAAEASNVVSFDVLEDRLRGGSRPGLARIATVDIGQGEGDTSPITSIETVNVVDNSGLVNWVDTFPGSTLASIWSKASWAAKPVRVMPYQGWSGKAYDMEGAVVRDVIADLDGSKAYSVYMDVVPDGGEFVGEYAMYLLMDDVAPDFDDDGCSVVFTPGADGAFTIVLRFYTSGVLILTSTYNGTGLSVATSSLRALVNGTSVKVYWQGSEVITATVGAAVGHRVGLGLATDDTGQTCLLDLFGVSYYSDNPVTSSRTVTIIVVGGQVYVETLPGVFVLVVSDVNLNDAKRVMVAERTQALFYADYDDPRVQGADGDVDAAGTALTADSVTDWTALGIDIDNDVCVISDGQGGVVDATVKISVVAAGSVTLATSVGTTGTCSFSIVRAPKVLEPASLSLAIYMATADKGQVPTECRIMCRYRDRIVLAAPPDFPHLWYMSRQGDPYDWDYFETDVGRAVAGQNSDAGVVGEPITAMIPHSDDYLLFGCANSLWVLRGDPAYGGQIDCLSRNVGVIDKFAWCWGLVGECYILARDGIYMVPPGARAPEPVSDDRLPTELAEIDTDLYEICMGYDHRHKAVLIFASPKAEDVPAIRYWLDIKNKAFWPIDWAANFDPMSIMSSNKRGSGVVIGCRDGVARRFDRAAVSDDGDAIESYIVMGPFKLASDGWAGVLAEMMGTLSLSGGGVDWDIRAGDNAEALIGGIASASGFFAPGLNHRTHPRCRGGYAMIKLANSDMHHWALESIVIRVAEAGKVR